MTPINVMLLEHYVNCASDYDVLANRILNKMLKFRVWTETITRYQFGNLHYYAVHTELNSVLTYLKHLTAKCV